MAKIHRIDVRSIMTGLFCSVLGFSWSVATVGGRAAGIASPVTPRSVGSNLHFSNPFLLPGQDPQFPSGGSSSVDPSGFDLGDACVGSQLQRFISALDGVHPYAFSVIGAQGSPGLTLDPSGRLTGALVGSSQSFTALVHDPSAASRFGYFLLTAKNYAPGDFRFEIDRLPAARVGMDYITNIECCNQDSSTVFSVLSGSVMLNGVAIANLEAEGLTLAKDGNLSGRPLSSGVLSFTARATNGSLIATNRAGTALDQFYSISIGPQSSIQTVLGASSAIIRGKFNGQSVPKLTLSAFIVTLGQTAQSFANQRFILRIGGQTFQTKLNSWGSSSRSLHVCLSGSFINVVLKDAALMSILTQNMLSDGAHSTLIVEIEIGTTFIGTEAIQFTTKANKNNFKLSFALSHDSQLGGLFQITSVQSLDSFSGNGTQFRSTFLISPTVAPSDFGAPQSATIRIGPNFVQTVPLHGRKNFHGSSGKVSNLSVNLNNKSGVVTTFLIPESQSGVKTIAEAGSTAQTFLLGVDLQSPTRTFSGDSAQLLIPAPVVIILDPFFFDPFFDPFD